MCVVPSLHFSCAVPCAEAHGPAHARKLHPSAHFAHVSKTHARVFHMCTLHVSKAHPVTLCGGKTKHGGGDHERAHIFSSHAMCADTA